MRLPKNVTDESHTALRVESPVPGPDGSWFALYIPKNIDWTESYDALVWHVEFRRKCMNQGFDNLLELLAKAKENMAKDAKAKA